MKIRFLLLLLICTLPFVSLAGDAYRHRPDSTHIFRKLDTTYIDNYRDLLTVKLITAIRYNSFKLSSLTNKQSIEYSINNKLNLGLGMTFKGIGFEVQYSPKWLNQNDEKYGKSSEFALSSSGNTRRFIYDVYYRRAEGFHSKAQYVLLGDTVASYYKRPDLVNQNLGANILYIFNNKRFSSSAPYNLTQRQRKSAGSFLLGAYAFVYTLDADTLIFPDTMYRSFSPHVQLKSAAALTAGLSIGYTYTLVFGKYWFINIATVPGISIQQFQSINGINGDAYVRNNSNLSLQSRFSFGYNRRDFFLGFSYTGSNFLITGAGDKESSINYKFGFFRIYYGHRFDIRKMLKKHL